MIPRGFFTYVQNDPFTSLFDIIPHPTLSRKRKIFPENLKQMFDKLRTFVYNESMISSETLKILTGAAKFDVSCSSSGSKRTNAGGIGNAAASGCCHTFTPDGRCVSLLKILLSNDCIYDCKYCLNRASVDTPRATADPDDLCNLVIDFYKRNYIEGLFLSSAVHISPNHTMEVLLRVVKKLRLKYNFHGYIHVKGIPRADMAIAREAAKYADRMSYNIELPTERSLKLLAPQKSKESLLVPMKTLQQEREIFLAEKRKGYFLPAGQTTQMIVGASPEPDGQILRLTQSLYRKNSLKRVYYSSYMPVVHDSLLPERPAGALREHRLYQADWLLRFYGFSIEELLDENENLSPEFDPKCAWALKNMHLFPVEVNRAPLEVLLRVPGIGGRSAQKIIEARRYAKLGFEDLKKMRVVLKRARHFITANGKFFGTENTNAVRGFLASAEENANAEQLSLFSAPQIALSALTGEL